MTRLGGLCIACLASVLPALLPGQEGAQEVETRPKRNAFMQAWVAELLDCDRKADQLRYKRIASDPNLPAQQSALALVRLLEQNWLRGERREVAENTEKLAALGLDLYQPPYSSPLGRMPEDFAAALAEKDLQAREARLQELRSSLQERLTTSPRPRRFRWDSRPFMEDAAKTLRLEQEAVLRPDSEIQKLREQRIEALARGDRYRARQIMLEMRGQQPNRRRSSSQRILVRREVQITRMHMRGDHEGAARLERLLGRRRSADPQRLISQMTQLSPLDQKLQLAKVQKLLDGFIAKRDSTPEEQKILKELKAKLNQMAADGKHGEALVLVARLPYRRTLLPN